LFRYAKPNAFPEGQSELPTGIFQDPNLSCDWKKFRMDPYSSFHIQEGKSVVVLINVCDDIRNPKNPKRKGEIVDDWKQEIFHDPITKEDDPIHGANGAHSLIRGKKKKAVVDALIANSDFYQRT